MRDDIGWGLDYDWLKAAKDMEEVPHKKYLNDYLTGKWPGSYARGELYNDDPASGDAHCPQILHSADAVKDLLLVAALLFPKLYSLICRNCRG